MIASGRFSFMASGGVAAEGSELGALDVGASMATVQASASGGTPMAQTVLVPPWNRIAPAAVEQAHVGVADGLAAPQDLALDHGLLGDVDPVEGQPALGRAAHQASPASSPRTTGTPTSEPYSVHEPS